MLPTPVRRPLTITTWIVLSLVYLLLSPLLLALAATTSAVMRRPQPLLLARMLVAYFARELGVLLACGVLWVRSGLGWRMRTPRIQRLHYRLLEWFIHGLAAEALALLEIEVAPAPSSEARAALERDQPLLCFSRHAGPGDTVFIVDLLQSRYRRLPSVVFRDALAIDPSVDLIGHRLPTRCWTAQIARSAWSASRRWPPTWPHAGFCSSSPRGGTSPRSAAAGR